MLKSLPGERFSGLQLMCLMFALISHDPKKIITPSVSRTHTYSSTIQILCEAFGLQPSGRDPHREMALIEAAWKLNHETKLLVPILDDAHIMDLDWLRKLRRLFKDFPQVLCLLRSARPRTRGHHGIPRKEAARMPSLTRETV